MANQYTRGKEPKCPIGGPNCIGVIRTRGARACHPCGRMGPQEPAPIVVERKREPVPASIFEREWQVWMREIGMAKDRYRGPAQKKSSAKRTKILVVPDIHAPFHNREAVAAMIERESDADIAMLMGDIGDSYSLSRFLKYEHVPYEEELASVTALMQTFSERFPLVRLIEGNHDGARVEKYLLERLSGDMVAAIRAMTGGTLSPIEALARRFPNIERVMPAAGRHRLNWMTQIGDAIFMHAERFSRVPGSALRGIEEWLSDMEGTLELQPWRVVFQAHTHQMSHIFWHADKVLVEVGCLSSTHGYQVSPRMGGRPQRVGWVTLEMVNGAVDVNSIRMVSWPALAKQ